MKRLVGLPGETVHEDEKGFIDVDGKRLYEPYIERARRREDTAFLGKTWHVRAESYFMLGDNRAESCDVRACGAPCLRGT